MIRLFTALTVLTASVALVPSNMAFAEHHEGGAKKCHCKKGDKKCKCDSKKKKCDCHHEEEAAATIAPGEHKAE